MFGENVKINIGISVVLSFIVFFLIYRRAYDVKFVKWF